jgi:hypothetical protein
MHGIGFNAEAPSRTIGFTQKIGMVNILIPWGQYYRPFSKVALRARAFEPGFNRAKSAEAPLLFNYQHSV